MNDLRLVLLLIGVAIIAGLYLRERMARRHRAADELQEPDTVEEPDFNLYTSASSEEDVSSAISVLKRARAGEDNDTLEPMMRTDRGHTGQAAPDDTIITLHVAAVEGEQFRGPAILRAVRRQDMRFGDMNIFHHYGIGDMHANRPLFHLANMMEPGVFDPEAMHGFQTRGLTLFMQLPTPLDAQVVFDLMLNTATRLAEELGGRVMTHDHRPLTDDRTRELYDRIARMEQAHG